MDVWCLVQGAMRGSAGGVILLFMFFCRGRLLGMMRCFFTLVLLVVCAAGGMAAGRGGVKPEEQRVLDAQGFVVTGQALRQGFSAYIASSYPVFITSDSVLMTYTTLLEKVMAEQQMAMLAAHVELVLAMNKNMPAADAGEGARETRLFLACAHRILLGWVPEGLSGEESKLVEAEAGRVLRAEAVHPPVWWGKGEYMPYSRFVPTSVWAGSESMERYFRYQQWMQSLPVLKKSVLHRAVCRHLRRVLDKAGYGAVHYALDQGDTGVEDRGVLYALQKLGTGGDRADEAISRVLSNQSHFIAYAPTPDKKVISERLNKTRDLRQLGKRLGWVIGSRAGQPQEALTETEKQMVEAKASVASPGHDDALFQALAALTKDADSRAPRVFHSEAWKYKQLNCVMGAWAEYRHAVAISQTTSVLWLCAHAEPPGYVEPVPGFYQRLGIAAGKLAWLAAKNGDQMERQRSALLALRLEQLVRRIKALEAEAKGGKCSAYSVRRNIGELQKWHGGLLNSMFKKSVADGGLSPKWDLRSGADRRQLIQAIDAACVRFWRQDAKTHDHFARYAKVAPDSMPLLLQRFRAVCFRLEALARKQLEGEPWNSNEVAFIRGYGKTVARMAGYYGNSYLSPRDDAPRIVQIAHLGSPGGEKILLCGTARPRKLLIYFPGAQGKKTLCQGAVYSYREQVSASPVTDAQWREMCKESQPPEWIRLE